ncbi:MAG: primosomal protein N' [Planctomycetota bacterium]
MGSATHGDALFDDGVEPVVGYARVAVERGLDSAEGGLTYAVPQSLDGSVKPGRRVVVPLGRGKAGGTPTPGFVLERIAEPDEGLEASRIKAILRAEDALVGLPEDLMQLAKWVAAYYACPLGMVLQTMLPAAVKKQTGLSTKTLVRRSPFARSGETNLTKLQQAIVDAASDTDWTTPKQLVAAAGAKTQGPVKKLMDAGVLEVRQLRVVDAELEAPDLSQRGATDVKLMPAQEDAVDKLTRTLGGFEVSLLHGVTGSGKTEVYLRLIQRLLKRDRKAGVVVLVPEISLTPQAVARYASRFEADADGQHPVAVLHSGMTAAQRHAQWRRIRAGEARLVVGARSAVFAPIENLKLIVVDEEHDASYKQDQLPRYHARDVAIRRAQMSGCPVVLGSATPALESYANAMKGKFEIVSLPDRVPGARLPQVELVDLVEERRERAKQDPKDQRVHLLSRRMEDLLRATLDDGGQAVLLLNRRGFANYLACPDQRCGWLMQCEHCDTLMVYHLPESVLRDPRSKDAGVVRCHHCLTEQRLPDKCPECSKKIVLFGMGTQRVEQELRQKLPDARLLRMDADAMRSGRDFRKALWTFQTGQADILLGTQMIAKGLDVPNVRMVGVVSADTSLNFPDFRAAERTFQLIAQVSGRAGRGKHAGRVVLQTMQPGDPTIREAADHDYVAFAQRELELREHAGLPPNARLARIVVRDPKKVEAFAGVTRLHRALADAIAQLAVPVRLVPPAPCPIERLADHYRFQVLLFANQAADLQRVLTALRNTVGTVSDHHTAIDVDPVALL